MSAEVVESPAWSRRKWWTVISLLLLLHVGFIFWLARGETTRPVRASRVPRISLLTGSFAEIPGLSDPTLLVLPSHQGFSGKAWLEAPALEYRMPEWPGPAGLLTLSVGELGGTLIDLVQSNLSQPLVIAERPEPGLNAMKYYVQPELMPTQSTFRVEGELAGRPLLDPFKLKSWPALDILTNSVVEVVVDEDGRLFSPPILRYRSGSALADTNALDLAQSARFQPVRRRGPQPTNAPPPGLTWGSLVFQWHTVPMPPDNAPATGQ